MFPLMGEIRPDKGMTRFAIFMRLFSEKKICGQSDQYECKDALELGG